MEVFLQQIKVTDSSHTGWELHHDIFQQMQARNPLGARQAARRLIKHTLLDSRKHLSPSFLATAVATLDTTFGIPCYPGVTEAKGLVSETAPND